MLSKQTVKMSPQSIAFCTTCKDRGEHLKQTLPHNLANIREQDVINIVDYGSTDGISDWIWENFHDHICNKKINLFQVITPTTWNMSRAKNLAHRMAKASFLFSLDADNFITREDIAFITGEASRGNAVHQFAGNWNDGTCGRIGMARDIFICLRGYNERGLPMGGEDLDIRERLLIHGVKVIRPILPPRKMPIQHSVQIKMESSGTKTQDKERDWQEMNRVNLQIFKYFRTIEGATNTGTFTTHIGLLNGRKCIFDGLSNEPTFME